jgi:hypothetical protein
MQPQLHGAHHGRRLTDEPSEQPRAERHHGPAGGRGEDARHDDLCPDRPRGGRKQRQDFSLGPTELLIFGNAKAGTPLMQAAQSIGIDLPLKALVWQDASGSTWISYNDPSWLANRHTLAGDLAAVIGNMATALEAVANEATSA